MCSFLQDGLKNLSCLGLQFATSEFFSHHFQRKIKPFEIILQIFGYILAKCQVDNLLPVCLPHLLPETEYNR